MTTAHTQPLNPNALPDLYAACEEAQHLFAFGVGAVSLSDATKDNAERCINEGRRVMGIIKAALSKARGEQPAKGGAE